MSAFPAKLIILLLAALVLLAAVAITVSPGDSDYHLAALLIWPAGCLVAMAWGRLW